MMENQVGAKNNNNFDTTSEIMFLALDPPPPRQQKKSKICSEQTIYFFSQKMLMRVKNRKKPVFMVKISDYLVIISLFLGFLLGLHKNSNAF